MRLGLFFFIALLQALPAEANEVIIRITGVEERKDYFSGETVCDLEYEIENNSTGTIYGLVVHLNAWDDRGDRLSNFGSPLENVLDGSSSAIAVGETERYRGRNSRGGFETECQYLRTVRVSSISDGFCNIRMFPDDIACEDVVTLISSIPQIVTPVD